MRKKLLFFLVGALLVVPSGCGHTHVLAADTPVAATCTQPGLEGGIHCAECNKVLVLGYEVAPTGHTPVVDPAVPVTNSAPGRTEGSHCSVCKEVIIPQTIVEMKEVPAETSNAQQGVLVRISNENLAIFSGPGYDNELVGVVGTAGSYTIVAQETDNKGNVWGRLKSGLGWINMAGTELSPQAQENSNEMPIRILNGDQPIFSGPGYIHDYVGTVDVAGTYTIVAQKRDGDGTLWGKLKSGLGWIDLTDVAQRTESQRLITANYADESLLGSGNYHRYGTPGGAGMNSIAFRARETVYDVEICAYDIFEEEAGDPFFHLQKLTTDKPLVANLMFPGDYTTYCLKFTDQSGNRHARAFSINLCDWGGISFEPCNP